MKKVVLTGGPSGGKSSFIRFIESEDYPHIETVPEVATILLSGGFPPPSEKSGWTYNWQRSFQAAIAITQIALEQIVEEKVLDQDKVVLFDRGLADGASYLNRGIVELSEITKITPREMFERYDKVIHLTTSAKQARGYNKGSNPHRFEDANKAIELDNRVMEAWSQHHDVIVINENDKKLRNQTIVQEILDI